MHSPSEFFKNPPEHKEHYDGPSHKEQPLKIKKKNFETYNLKKKIKVLLTLLTLVV